MAAGTPGSVRDWVAASESARARRQRRKTDRVLVYALACLLIGAGLSGGYGLVSTYAGSHRGSLPIGPAFASVYKHTLKVCTSVTTCTTSGIAVLAYSTLLVFVDSQTSATAPSGISSSPSLTWTTDGDVSSTTSVNRESYVYHTDNVSAQASATVTVTYAASTTYYIGVVSISNTTTSSLDHIGTGVCGSVTSGSTSPFAVSWSTTVTASTNDVVFSTSISGNLASWTSITSTTIDTSGAVAIDGSDNIASGGTITITSNAHSTSAHITSFYCSIAVALKTASVPGAPTSLTLGAVTTSTVALTWTKSAGPIVNFTVDQASYGTSCGAFSTHYSVGTTASYTVTGLSGGPFCFQVDQWNSSGESSGSNILSDVALAHAPTKPTGLAVTAIPGSTTSLNVYWVQPLGALVNSTVYVYSSTICSGSILATNSTGTAGGLDFNWSVSSLTANTAYGVEVTAWNSTGQSSATSCVSATTNSLPGAPTGLGVSSLAANSVTLSWTQASASETILNDTVLYGTTCGTWTGHYSAGASSTATVSPLPPVTRQCFTVEAWTAGGVGPVAHPYINATTTGGPPTPVSNLHQVAHTISSITVNWTQGNPGGDTLTNNTVDVGTVCNTWAIGQFSTGGAATQYFIAGLSGGTNYCISVTAWDHGGQSTLTYGNFTTLNNVPGAPFGLHEISAAAHNFSIAWTNPSGSIVNDTVVWTTVSACASSLSYASTQGASTSWTVTGLTPFVHYYVEIGAWTNGGEGPYSACLSVITQSSTPPSPVINATKTTVGTTWVNLWWSNPALFTLFNDTIFYGQLCGSRTPPFTGWGHSISTNGVTTFWNVTGLASNTTFCFSVVDWDGPSNGSGTQNFTTLLANAASFLAKILNLSIFLLVLLLGMAVAFLGGINYVRRRRGNREGPFREFVENGRSGR